MTRRRTGAALVACALLAGCPKEDAPSFDENDRTIQRLKAEKDRLDAQAKRPVPDPLVEAAVKQEPAKTLTLPGGAPVQAGGASFALKKVETMQSVSGAKTSLSTADRFVKVTLAVSAAREAPVDLAAAALSVEAERPATGSADEPAPARRRFGIARDVQRLAAGPLSMLVGAEPREVVIFFEAPPDAIKKGLMLVLPTEAGPVELPLQ